MACLILSHRLLYKRSPTVHQWQCPTLFVSSIWKIKKIFLNTFFFASQLLFTRQICSTNVAIFLLFFRDALITCIVNTLTCLTAGVLVFSILGYMAHLTGSTVQDVARSGPGLVFLTYPELVLSLPGSFIWAILFFAMLLVIIRSS